MGAFFLAYPVPETPGLNRYRQSLRILAISYFVMAILILIILLLESGEYRPGYFSFFSILLSSLQATLFTYTLIVLLNPGYVTRKRLLINLMPAILFTTVYFAVWLKVGECRIYEISDLRTCITNAAVIVRFLFFLYYCIQLVAYVFLFLKQEKIYVARINNSFSDVSELRLKWVRRAFFTSLLIGIMAILIQILPDFSYTVFFDIILTIFYFSFALKYINYNKIFCFLAPVITSNEIIVTPAGIYPKPRIDWNKLKKKILTERYYLREGITLEEMAQLLKIGRTSLSNFINTEEGVSFNTWINQFRIEEAKMLLLSNPDYNLIKIAGLTGYSEQSNFSRQFKIITGESPLQWRKKAIVY